MTAGQRRLAAIVAADVAGYSRLIGANEEQTIACLRSHRAKIIDPTLRQHNGRIANTAGDSLLIEFPSAVDAVRWSIGMQKAIAAENHGVPEDRCVRYRIGINVGDVVRHDDDLLGDGVNVAARLEALAEPGGICLSRSTRDQVRDRLDLELHDLGEIEVKNIARPVRVFQVLADGVEIPSPPRKTVAQRKHIAFVMIVMVAIAGAAIWWIPQTPVGAPDVDSQSAPASNQPSIAVLPFTNLSEDKGQSYFADGITEDITTDLARVSGLNVTSRLATLRFRNGSEDPLGIAVELGVGHLLEGSVRRSGDTIRITAKLINAGTGEQMWAERFDRKTEDIFAIQDEISDRVVQQLSKTLEGVVLSRKARSYTPNVEAYDLYIRGRAQRIPPTPPNLKAAMQSFNRAIKLDPDFAGGYAGASYVHVLIYSEPGTANQTSINHLDTALQLARKAVELDPGFGPAWGSLAEAYFRSRDFDKALEAVQTAIKLAPSDSLMRAFYGRFLGHVGRTEEGIAEVKSAMRMSPDSLPMLYFLGANYRSNKNFKLAIEALTEHRKRLGGRILPAPTAQLIAAYVQAGMIEAARKEVVKLLKVAPDYTAGLSIRTSPYKNPEDEKLFLGALGKAGLPD